MFCPSCGFEYTQKTNYCKRCGDSLSITSLVDAPKVERPKLALMFCAIAAFAIVGMLTIFTMYGNLARQGLRGDELIIPFVMSLMFTGAISGLLIWQLSRLITAYKEMGRTVVVDKQYIREAPPSQLGAPADPSRQSVEPPSVVEHTTRQFAGKYRE
ncbi:MAG TPA: zinc ribbon domain-containing protein [Blastocatellia bacterium]|nr:zinc ribbon domain-containing protein [Blastocatellia bacterium]